MCLKNVRRTSWRRHDVFGISGNFQWPLRFDLAHHLTTPSVTCKCLFASYLIIMLPHWMSWFILILIRLARCKFRVQLTNENRTSCIQHNKSCCILQLPHACPYFNHRKRQNFRVKIYAYWPASSDAFPMYRLFHTEACTWASAPCID
jgi:hypothetical protein